MTKIPLPGFKAVKSYTRDEAKRRRYAIIPKWSALRRKLDRKILDLPESPYTLPYLRGEYDRKRGRPKEFKTQKWLNERKNEVNALRAAENITIDKAIERVLKHHEIDDPESKMFIKLKNFVSRKPKKRPRE